jgi:hypothetical protein
MAQRHAHSTLTSQKAVITLGLPPRWNGAAFIAGGGKPGAQRSLCLPPFLGLIMVFSNEAPEDPNTANDELRTDVASISGPSLEIDVGSALGAVRPSLTGDTARARSATLHTVTAARCTAAPHNTSSSTYALSYTMSATSSVFNFRYEHGRRYHAYAEGKYPVPNDEVTPLPVRMAATNAANRRPKWTDSTFSTTPLD